MPTRPIEIGTAGPAYNAAAWPVSTKIPAPMMAPTPSVTRLNGPRVRLSDLPPVASASARSAVMDLVAQRDMAGILAGGARNLPGPTSRVTGCGAGGRIGGPGGTFAERTVSSPGQAVRPSRTTN